MYTTAVLCALWGLVLITPFGLFGGAVLTALAGRMPKEFRNEAGRLDPNK